MATTATMQQQNGVGSIAGQAIPPNVAEDLHIMNDHAGLVIGQFGVGYS